MATAATILLAALTVLRHAPDLGFRIRGFFRMVRLQFTGVKFEARLNEVACGVCRKGTGVYDPIQVNYKGIPHIEGTCNCCGAYVRARLN